MAAIELAPAMASPLPLLHPLSSSWGFLFWHWPICKFICLCELLAVQTKETHTQCTPKFSYALDI